MQAVRESCAGAEVSAFLEPGLDVDREGLDEDRAVAVMVANPSCIKRPILEYPGGYLLGFKEAEWGAALT